MSVRTLQRTPLAVAILFAFAPAVHAQTDSSRLSTDPDSVPTVVVSASTLGVLEDDMITPVTSLSGGALVRARESTIGETLANQPGITSSHFGAGASRPVIRGMDGPRVKILSDGAEVQDASTISPDHAVGFEPILAERIEVLRGPSALAYGGGAVGGVVNILDRKIPTQMPAKPVEGSMELRANSVAREKTGAFEITGGAGNIAVHAEGVKRDAGDYRVGKDWDEGRRVNGSYKETESGTVGLSWVGERGYIGAAYTKERTEYGIPGHNHEFESCHPHGDHLHCGGHGHEEEEEGHDHEHEHEHGEEVPVVKLDSDRWDVRGEYRNPMAGITKARLRASFTDYRHDELEEGVVATSFLNKGHDVRVEMEHAPVGGVRGVFGLQTTRRDFNTVGEEAYVPPTVTRKHAAFITEEYKLDNWRFEAGARHEWQDIKVDSASARDTDARGTSVALGAVWKFQPQYSLRAGVARSHRLPTSEELYADGVHLATATYEVGNQDLGKETSNNIDVTLRKFEGDTTFSLSAFHNKVDNYIYARTLDNHEGFQLVEYAQRDAVFTGLEGEVRHKFSNMVEGTLFGDMVRARFDKGEEGSRNIPRIPAHRIGARVNADWQAWHGMVEVVRVGKQDRVAEFEGTTGGYNMVNLGGHYTTRIGGVPAQLYARINNLTDELAFSHTSFIKEAAPLPGRNITAGLRFVF
ncbi:TonB-dependent receptor [Massilia sp. G4R7]|uniref:TonB-dependent receptor n=1 Tax=Massilia phyllostachyos TaxID=2898585 RepID=A0ABS8Q8V0_9BURK|nr:TonB-dependent receptor [Massilia phyllostachyos]MCD2518190.1 TonB-dependent receptor [Massilia phyllostachyos]